ncbi:MAG: asparagine synthase (glutamine-hydrolyzing) [Anaeroplasmataceae bacterium]|nr:asparagine synthase (glutamine-hydrolyzing) [Anaeroplasmataceae bacterium]
MCGIFYKSNFYSDTDEEKFIRACNLLNHRGPDDSGFLFNKEHSFGHKRLAIRDVVNAKQPMSILNDHLIYNGEIYNQDDLLKKLDAPLEFNSDTLLLLHLLIKYKEDIFKELNGIFAFVYTHMDEVWIVRDMFGVKPLYYTFVDKDIIVSSEMKSILEYTNQRVVDKDGLCELLGMGPSHSQAKTVFKGIYELRPGHYLKWKKGSEIEDHTYYQLEAKEFNLTYEETKKRVRFLLDRAIQRQMISDVDLSTFLSGGLDSSIISTIVAMNKESLDTYSISYENSEFKENDFERSRDSDFTHLVSDAIGSNQHDIMIDNKSLIEGLRKAVLIRDVPGMTDIDSSMYFLAKNIRNKHRLGLSGECADEVFGGYPWFYEKKRKLTTFPWIRNLDYKESLLTDKYRRLLNLKKYVMDEFDMAINETPVLKTDSKTTIKERQLSYINMKYFMTNLLDRKDRLTMGASIEVRVPFCDKDLVDFLYNVPFKYKYRSKVEKKLLRDAYKGTVIDEVIERKKSPYPKSNSSEYHKGVVKLLEEVLLDSNSILYEIFDIHKIRDIMQSDEELEVPWYGQLMRKTAFLAYLYQIDYWFKTYKIKLEIE